MRKKFTLLMVIAIGFLLLSGCFGKGFTIPLGDSGESITIGGSDDKVVIKGEDGKEVKIEQDGDEGFSVEGEDVSWSIGKQEIPDGFPEDIPFPKDFQIGSSFRAADETTTNMSVMFETTSLTFDETLELYKNYLEKAGYKIGYETSMPGYTYFSAARNDEQEVLTIGVNGEEDSEAVKISINYVIKESE